MKNRLIYALLPTAALIFAGCDECEKAFELKNDLYSLETLVTGTMGQPSRIEESCKIFQGWYSRLAEGSNFADRVADTHFYWIDRYCVSGHYERRCHWVGGSRRHGDGYWSCHSYYVCDFYESRGHKKDGYDQAKELARLLTGARGDLTSACASNSSGNGVDAVLNLTQAKIKLSASQNDADYVLQKAGCYDRRGH
jgi:hypothetical protein